MMLLDCRPHKALSSGLQKFEFPAPIHSSSPHRGHGEVLQVRLVAGEVHRVAPDALVVLVVVLPQRLEAVLRPRPPQEVAEVELAVALLRRGRLHRA